MSTTVDERVVSMQFDNKHFESNVKTTMSTLEKFKQSLNLKGAAKGLEDVNYAAKKVDMSSLGGAVETVKLKFSALEVIAVTALANITNSAINTGKRMVSALTIDPIKTGFNEYETKMNSIQTIMSNTASKGTTMEDVTRTIDELNTYADKTIYNFSEMTRNIGTFTAAGVGLEDSAKAIQGIANLAAASGSNSQQASTAMYQLSQALATGKVKLMDWNSVVNAGMGGELFQNALKETARVHGVAVDEIIAKNGSFRDSLHEEWLTADILTETLQKMTKSGAAEYLSNLTGISLNQITATQKLVDENKDGTASYDELAESMAATGKITKEQAINILKQADSAEDAATKVKTFTQLWDTLKESAQSGWGKTWELIFGDFEEAKELFTSLSDFLGGFINKMNDARNALIEGALDLASPWTKIMEKLEGAGLGKIKEVADSVGNAADKLEYFQNIVNDVWRGDYKNADTGRYDLLKQAGYDDRVVQELVNKGYQYELTVEDVEAAHKKFGLTMNATSEETKELTDSLNNLTEKQLKEAGLTEEEIKLYMDLQAEADRTGKSVSELAEEMSKNDGRTLLIDSFKNAGQGLVAIFKALGEAWREIFPPMSVVQLYNIIKGINEFSQHLRVGDETADKLKKTFKGVFAILDLVFTLVGGPLKIGFKVLTTILGAFDMNILDLTAKMGDAIVKFRDWIDENNIFVKAIKATPEFLAKFAKNVQKWVTSVRETENLGQYIIEGLINGIKNGGKTVVTGIINFAKNVQKWVTSVRETENLGQYIIEGLINGIKNGGKTVVTGIINFAKSIIEGFCEILGIHSPSRVFEGFGENIIQGLFNGLQNGIGGLVEFVKGIGTRLAEAFGNIDFAEIFSLLAAAGVLAAIKTLADAFDAIASPLQGLGELMQGAGEVMQQSAKNIGKVIKSFSKVMNSVAFSIKVSALKNLAIGIAILVGCVIALTFVDTKEALKAVGIIFLLSVILGVVAIAVSKLASASATIDKNGVKLGGVTSTLISIGAALLLMAAAVKILGKMEPEQYQQGFMGLIGMIGGMILVIAAFGKLTQGLHAANIKDFGKMLMKLSFALLLLVGVVKLISLLTVDEMKQGAIFAAGFAVFIAALSIATSLGNGIITKIGGTILAISVALALLVGVVKLTNKLTPEDMESGKKFAIGFLGFVAGLLLVCRIAKGELPKLGGMLLAMSLSMLLLIGVVKLVGQLNKDEMLKGVAFAGAFLIFVGAIVAIAKFGGSEMAKIGTIILAMSVAIAILAGICVLLGFIKTENLIKGGAAIGALMAMLSVVLLAARGVQDVKSTMWAIAATVAILVLAIAGLSFIDPKKLIAPTVAIGSLMAMFAVVLKASKNVKKADATIYAVAAVVGVLGWALSNLAESKWQNTMGAAAGIAVVMVVIAGVLKTISSVHTVANSALIALGALTLIVGALGWVLSKLAVCDYKNSIGAAVALSALLIVMVGVLKLISSTTPYALGGVITLGALTLVVGLLGGVLLLLSKLNVESAIGISVALSTLLLSMSAALVLLGVAGTLAGPAIAGMGLLGVLIAGMTAVLLALGGLFTAFSGLEGVLDTGIGVLDKIGSAIGSFVGSIVAGFGEAVGSMLPVIGEQLSQFMTNVTPFIEGAKTIDESVLLGVGALAGAILLLTAADLISGVISFIQGGSSFADLGTQLSEFIANATPFIASASLLNEDMMNGVKALAETILILTAADVLSGLASLFGAGDSSLSTFSEELPVLGTGIRSFLDNVGTLSETETATITAAANAVKTLASAAAEIPNTGGLLADLVGDNEMTKFAASFPILGSSLREFLTNIGTFSDAETATVTAAANAVKTLAAAASEIPNTGGLLADIVGDNDMKTFASGFPALGTGLRGFLNNVGTFSDAEVATVTAAADAVKSLAAAANEIPNSGGWIAKIIGDNNMADFANDFQYLGKGLVNFADEVDGIDAETIKPAVEAVSMLVDLANNMPDSESWIEKFLFGSDDMDEFAKSMEALGEGLYDFADEVEGIDVAAVGAAVSAAQVMVEIANDVDDLADMFDDEDEMDAFEDNMDSFGKGIKNFSSAVTGIDSVEVSKGATAGKSIAGMCSAISELGGFSNIFGEGTNLDAFGTQLVVFGYSIRRFAETISGTDYGYVTQGVNAGVKIANMASQIANAGGIASLFGADTSMSTFGNELTSFGISIRRFAQAVSGVDIPTVKAGVEAGKSMIQLTRCKPAQVDLDSAGTQLVSFGISIRTFANEINAISISGLNATVNQVNNTLNKIASIGIGNMIISFTRAKSQLATAMNSMLSSSLTIANLYKLKFALFGKALMGGFVEAIDSKKSSVTSAIRSAVRDALSAVMTQNAFEAYKRAGKYMVIGFARGISENDYMVEAKARAMANAAKEAAEDALDINSPSRVAYTIGSFFNKGFVNALGDGEIQSYKAAWSMADSASEGFNNAISKIKGLIEGDLDVQPTIRPVLDLSDVSSGAGALSSMFNGKHTVGLMSNINSISAAMNRGQNGGNNDVVSAIKDLEKAVNSKTGDTYTINGITYDDGSNVASAVKSIIRAAKVERRV